MSNAASRWNSPSRLKNWMPLVRSFHADAAVGEHRHPDRLVEFSGALALVRDRPHELAGRIDDDDVPRVVVEDEQRAILVEGDRPHTAEHLPRGAVEHSHGVQLFYIGSEPDVGAVEPGGNRPVFAAAPGRQVEEGDQSGAGGIAGRAVHGRFLPLKTACLVNAGYGGTGPTPLGQTGAGRRLPAGRFSGWSPNLPGSRAAQPSRQPTDV